MTYETWAKEYFEVSDLQVTCAHTFTRKRAGMIRCDCCALEQSIIIDIRTAKAAWDAAKRSGE